jgi:hypothetical protein
LAWGDFLLVDGILGGCLWCFGKYRDSSFAQNDEQQQPQQIMASELTTSPNRKQKLSQKIDFSANIVIAKVAI